MPHQVATETISLAAGGISREFSTADGRLRTVGFAHHGDTSMNTVTAHEFELTVSWEMVQLKRALLSPITLTSDDFVITGSALSASGEEATFTLEFAPLGLVVTLRYGVDRTHGVLVKRIAIGATGVEPIRIERVAAERFQTEGAPIITAGYGQPMLATHWWAGMSHPGSYTSWSDASGEVGIDDLGTVTPGQSLTVPEVVWGFSQEGDAKSSFFSYLDSVRARPVARNIAINTWYDLQHDDMTQANVADRITRFDEIMRVRRGVSADVYVVDDHWDDRATAWTIDPRKFPDGFGGIEAALAATGMRLGLWFGPVGGYGDERVERVAWYAENGYEVSLNGQYLCLAGHEYHDLFIAQLLEKITTHDIAYLKLDGMSFNCLNPAHGHPTGSASRFALIQALIDVLHAARVAAPNTFLSVTTGTWLSPWWLRWADAVFIGGEDYDWDQMLPSIEPRDAATTYRDGIIYDDLVVNTDIFPMSSLMSVGVIKGRLLPLGGSNESRRAWRHDLAMEISRGIMQTELYLSPDALSEDEWDDVCDALAWTAANDDLLLGHTEMILGDPRQGEVYGFAHRGDSRSLITLRNPALFPRTVQLDPTRWAPTAVAATWREIYPSVRTADRDANGISVILGPNEVVMLLAEGDAGSIDSTVLADTASSEATVVHDSQTSRSQFRISVDDLGGDPRVVFVAEGVANADDATALWVVDDGSESMRSHGDTWSALEVRPTLGTASVAATASAARTSVWLWRDRPIDREGAGVGPFRTQDNRVDAVLLWSSETGPVDE